MTCSHSERSAACRYQSLHLAPLLVQALWCWRAPPRRSCPRSSTRALPRAPGMQASRDKPRPTPHADMHKLRCGMLGSSMDGTSPSCPDGQQQLTHLPALLPAAVLRCRPAEHRGRHAGALCRQRHALCGRPAGRGGGRSPAGHFHSPAALLSGDRLHCGAGLPGCNLWKAEGLRAVLAAGC